jgi:tRNA(fMet)-specific endonuclease VapC
VRFLLDTNACIDFLTGRFPEVAERILASDPEDLCLSSVVVAELRYGADKSQKKLENHGQIDVLVGDIRCVDFDLAAAAVSGRIRAELERRGQPIGPYDLLIAAHALSLGLTVVTDNGKEFRRVEGLSVENWREPSRRIKP